MATGRASALTLANGPARLRFGLLLLISLGLGCVDLKQPAVLANRAGSVAGSSGGGRDGGAGTTGTGGAGTGSDSSGAGVSGSGGTDSAGGAIGGTADDAGMGGTESSSSAVDTGGVGGNTGIDALSDLDAPQGTGGSVSDAGGTGGGDGRTGGSGTKVDAGSGGAGGGAGSSGDAGGVVGPDARPDGAGGVGGTTAKDGSVAQDVGADGGVDTPPDVPFDSALPDAPCALCAIGASLVHRYTFAGANTSNTVTDTVGGANGTSRGVNLAGDGTLVLSGGSDQYVELPKSLLSSLTSATLEIWVTWKGGNNNQRILDFGNYETVSGKTRAVTTVIISPNSYNNNAAKLRASYSTQASSGNSTYVDWTGPLSSDPRQQIVAVFDGPGQTLSMYLNGAHVGDATGLGALSQIVDTNNMLGKSQWQDDPGFNGTYHEFRIYNAALTAAQVQAVFTAGTDANFSQ